MATATLTLGSQNRWLADGSTTIWNFNFVGGYLASDTVLAYSFLTDEAVRVDHTLEFISAFQVRITPAVAAGRTLVIYRDSSNGGLPRADFTDGGGITESNLDLMAKQSVFVSEEVRDFIGITTEADLASALLMTSNNAAAAAVSAASANVSADIATVAAASSQAYSALASTHRTAAEIAAANAAGEVDLLETKLAGTGSGQGASQIGYLPSGTGAIGRTVESKLRDFVSVKDFGAVGDGVVDDTAAIQAAIDAHRNIYVPPGTYKITSTIYMRRGMHLAGASVLDSILDGSTLTVPMFGTQLNRYGVGFANQGFRDGSISFLKFVGNTASTGNILIRTDHGWHRTHIHNNWFYSCGGDAIYIEADALGYGGYYNVIEVNTFGDPSDFATGSDTSLIKGNAIYAKGSTNQNTVRNNIFWRIKKSGIYLEGSATWSIQKWTIRENGIEGCGYYEPTVPRYGVAFGPFSNSMKVTENYIEANALFTPFTSGGAGIWASSGVLDLIVSDNLFASNQYGIKLDDISSAVITGNSFLVQSTYFDIKIAAIASNGLVTVGNNPSATGIVGKYLEVAVAAQPRVTGDVACAIKRGVTCLAGKFVPRLFGGVTEISCSAALGYFERVGDRLRVNFTFTVSNLNGATGLIGIAGNDGINLALPGFGGTIAYPFRSDAALLATSYPLYTSLVNLTAGYSEVQLVASQTGSFFAFLREQGDNVPNQNLNATSLTVGSILRGEFFVYV